MKKLLFFIGFLALFGYVFAAGDFFHTMDDIIWDQVLPGNVMPDNMTVWKLTGGYGDIIMASPLDIQSGLSVSGTTSMSGLLTLSNGMSVSSGNINFASSSQYLSSDESLNLKVDIDNNAAENFNFLNGAGTNIMTLDESGNLQIDGNFQADGSIILGDSVSDTITYNAKANSNILMNSYNMTNATGIIFGPEDNARIYWNGTSLVIEVS